MIFLNGYKNLEGVMKVLEKICSFWIYMDKFNNMICDINIRSILIKEKEIMDEKITVIIIGVNANIFEISLMLLN